MFRSPEYCDRYEYIPIQLDTTITTIYKLNKMAKPSMIVTTYIE